MKGVAAVSLLIAGSRIVKVVSSQAPGDIKLRMM